MANPELRTHFPVAAVTVYPQSALVERRGRVSLAAGETDLFLSGLPGSLTADSVRVGVGEDRDLMLIDVSSDARLIAPAEGSAYARLKADYEALLAERARLLARMDNLQSELALFLDEGNLAGRFAREQYLPVNVASWNEFFGFLRERLAENRARRREELFALLEQERKIAAAHANLSAAGAPPREEHNIRVRLSAARGGEFPLAVEYLQEGVFWYPVYALAGDPARNELTVAMSAVIGQATGEDWKDVEILLSTAVPRFSCSIPEVRSRRLRERDSEIELRKAPAPMRLGAMAKDELAESEVMRSVDLADKKSMASEKAAPAQSRQAPKKKASYRRKEALASPLSERMSSSVGGQGFGAESAPPPAPAMPPGSVSRPDDADVRTSAPQQLRQAVARLEAEISAAGGDFRDDPYYAELESVLRASREAPSLPGDGEDDLPGWMQSGVSPLESLGGYDYRYPVPGKRDISSSPVPGKVNVARKLLPVSFIHVTVPVEKESVYVRASFSNDAEEPLPAGPAQVFAGDSLIGSLLLQTLGPGEKGTVSLGAEKDIKVLRREHRMRRRRGVVSKEIITDYAVEIELASFKESAAEIMVYDRLPVSDAPREITVADFKAEPAPVVTERKILLWKLTLEPRGKRTLSFRYSIRHPADFRLVMDEDSTPHQPGEEA
jgi:hypothetical protein